MTTAWMHPLARAARVLGNRLVELEKGLPDDPNDPAWTTYIETGKVYAAALRALEPAPVTTEPEPTVMAHGDGPPSPSPWLPTDLADYRHRMKAIVQGSVGPCVYFLAMGIEIVYVGRTVNLWRRLQQHRESGKQFDRAFYLVFPAAELPVRERFFIKKLRPRLNCAPPRPQA